MKSWFSSKFALACAVAASLMTAAAAHAEKRVASNQGFQIEERH
jgi:hypothetical protein